MAADPGRDELIRDLIRLSAQFQGTVAVQYLAEAMEAAPVPLQKRRRCGLHLRKTGGNNNEVNGNGDGSEAAAATVGPWWQ